jgi:DNA invertase Pin-like site-specific DNA recombinase
MTRPTLDTRRALLVTRVSKDRSNVQRSPDEQESDLRRGAAVMGWDPIGVVCDVQGASRRTKGPTRKGWADVLGYIDRGDVDVVMCWEVSRLTRTMREYVDLCDKLEATGTLVASGTKTYDVREPDERFALLLEVGLAEREVEQMSKRLRRNTAASLAAGKPAGRLLFGYRRVYDTHAGNLVTQEPDPVTGPVVAELYERVAAGEPIKALMRELDARGVRPMGGGRWAHTSLRRVLTNPSYLGHRTHAGRVVVEGAWPPLVDAATFDRVAALLADPRRRNAQDNRVKHLLAGLVRCEVCHGRLTYRLPRQRNGPLYWCQAGGHVATGAPHLEAGVRRLVTRRLARPDGLDVFAEATVDVRGLGLELKTLQARLADADAELEAGEMSPRAHAIVERKCTPRITELERTLAAARRHVPAPLVALVDDDVREVERRYDELVAEHLVVARLVVRELLVGAELRRARGGQRDDLGLRFRWAGVGEVVEV